MNSVTYKESEAKTMIVAMQGQATEENIQQVIERMVELGFNVHRTTGANQTILAGVGTPSHFDGRAITEAFADGPDPEQVMTTTTTYVVASPDGAFRAAIQVSEVGGERYLDKSWRVR